MKTSNKDSVVINTKVDKSYANLINRFCRAHGITYYELLQNCVETLIKYTVKEHNITDDIDRAMTMFENCHGWKDAFNLCDPSTNPEVIFAAYFLQDTTGKKGIRSVLVEKPYFGIWTQTENVNDIFERTFCTLLPTIYKRLRRVGVELGTNTVIETITTLITMYGEDAEQAMFREIFEDCNRSEYGLKPHEGTPFRRKMHRKVDEMPGLDFKPYDVEP